MVHIFMYGNIKLKPLLMWHRWNIVETNYSSTDSRGQATQTVAT
jgi:hypothetical protein